MPKPDTKFKPGNPGKPRGAVTRRVRVASEFAQSFLKDSDFHDSMRVIMGNPRDPLFTWAVELVMAYAYGKPMEHLHQTSDGSLPGAQFNVAFLSYEQVFGDENTGSPTLAVPAEATELSVAGDQSLAGRHQALLSGDAPPRGED